MLKWGEHVFRETADPKYSWNPEEFMHKFDMIIASDVVYLPECLVPLFSSIQFFLKPNTGRCLLVSARVRYDGYAERIEELMKELKLKNEVVE